MIARHLPACSVARDVFDATVAIGEHDPRMSSPPLLPGETVGNVTSVPKRVLEFSAGRAAARIAMSRLGLPPMPVLRADDRAPIWPAGVTGSISHCETACIAVATLDQGIRALGVDIEENTPLPPDHWPIVCRDEELDWLASQPTALRSLLAKVIFSAKECAYKAQYTISKTLFGFDVMRLSLDIERSTFDAEILVDVPQIGRGTKWTGKFRQTDAFIVTGISIEKG
jgi:4'-phosphopantetheinyl transferase EntD